MSKRGASKRKVKNMFSLTWRRKNGTSTLTWASSSFSFISLCLHISTAFVVDWVPALALLLLRRTLKDTTKAIRGQRGLTVSHYIMVVAAAWFVYYQLTAQFLKHNDLHMVWNTPAGLTPVKSRSPFLRVEVEQTNNPISNQRLASSQARCSKLHLHLWR